MKIRKTFILKKTIHVFMLFVFLFFGCHYAFSSEFSERIEESRVFGKSLNIKYDDMKKSVLVNDFMKQHASCVGFLGDFLLRTTGSPTNVAIASVGCILNSGEVESFPINKFFTSKTKLIKKLDSKPLNPDCWKDLLSGKHGQVYRNGFVPLNKKIYEDYAFENVFTHVEGDKVKAFKKHLSDLISGDTCLLEDRRDTRLKEVHSEEMGFYYYHSEQAFILNILNDETLKKTYQNFLLDQLRNQNVKLIFFSIMTYFDPCMRCGDSLLRLSESKFWEQFLKQPLLDHELQSVPIKLLVEAAGIKEYNDPTRPGGPRIGSLRPKDLSKAEEHLKQSDVNPNLIIPRVLCSINLNGV